MATSTQTTAVQKLNEMYPNLDKSRIQATWYECNGDTTATIVKLEQIKQQPMVIQTLNGGTASSGGTSAAPTVVVVQQPQQMQTVVVQQPQPMQTVVVVQNPNNMAASGSQNASNITQQMAHNNGNCWRITLIVMWSLMGGGGAAGLLITGLAFIEYGGEIAMIFMIPGLVEGICTVLILYGLVKYDYCINIFGCVWIGIHFLVVFGYLIPVMIFAPYIMIYFLFPLIYIGSMFGFSIVLTKKIAQVGGNNGCCNC